MLMEVDIMPTKKITLVTTAPDGVTQKTRTTDRSYSHAVWVRRTEARWRKDVDGTRSWKAELAEKYQKQYDAKDPDIMQFGQELVEQWIRDCKARVRSCTAELEAGFKLQPWTCENWCGRIDLARKQVGSWEANGYEAKISPVSL